MGRITSFPTIYDELIKISSSYFRKQEAFCGLATESLTFRRHGTPILRLTITINLLTYYGDGPEMIINGDINQTIDMASKESNLGKGEVWYFLCPETGLLARTLYFDGKRFVHRKVIKALYAKQCESKAGRKLQKAFEQDKLFEKINAPYFKTHYDGKETRSFKSIMTRVNRTKAFVDSIYGPLMPLRQVACSENKTN